MPAQFVPEPLMLLPDGLSTRVELTTTQAADLAMVSGHDRTPVEVQAVPGMRAVGPAIRRGGG
jgi:hypothetical protein